MQVADVKLKLALDSSLYIWNWRVTLLFIFADVIKNARLVCKIHATKLIQSLVVIITVSNPRLQFQQYVPAPSVAEI